MTHSSLDYEPTDFQSWFYRGLKAAAAEDPLCATDDLVASSPQRDARACRLGCAYCCHFPVGASSSEVRYLADWIESKLSPEVFEALLASIVQRAVLLTGESWSEQAAAKRPCVLLDDAGACTAYAARPVACRGWHSRSLERCEAEFAGDRSGKPETDGPAYVACLGVHEGLRQLGDGETYELTTALARVFAGAPDLGQPKSDSKPEP